ncbi:MAG: hypothetical protein QW584_03700 [Thermofilaceae archaeon]
MSGDEREAKQQKLTVASIDLLEEWNRRLESLIMQITELQQHLVKTDLYFVASLLNDANQLLFKARQRMWRQYYAKAKEVESKVRRR